MRKITPRQQRFVNKYLVTLNGTQAAIAAGYSRKGAEVTASRLLRVPKVKAEIDAAIKRRADRVEVKSDDVLRALLHLAMADPAKAFDEDGEILPIHKMPPEARAAISSFDCEELWESGGENRTRTGNVRKIKFWDKPKALELLGKHLKLFTEKMELTGKDGGPLKTERTPDLGKLSDEQLDQIETALAATLTAEAGDSGEGSPQSGEAA